MTRSDEPRPRATVIELEPRRLRDGDGAAAAAARTFHSESAATGIDEATAWRHLALRLRHKTDAGRREWRLLLGAALVGGAVVAALWLTPNRPAQPPRPPSLAAATAPTVAAPPKAAPPLSPSTVPAATQPPSLEAPRVRVALSAMPRPVPVGVVDLDGQARVDLAPGGRVVASTDAGSTRVVLSRGSLRLEVKPREPGRRFQVESGPYRFVVVGTSFRVVRSAQTVDLWVFEGHVAVWRAEQLGPMVSAGGHWSGPLPATATTAIDSPTINAARTPAAATTVAQPAPAMEPPAMASSSPPAPTLGLNLPAALPVRSEALRPCETAAGAGRSREALDCYRRIGEGSDLASELALYEAARLELRLTGDVRSALDTLAAHDQRFPHGALRSEVDLTRVELLPRVGEHQRALQESERILREHPGHERRRELHLLRGNIYREALGDCPRAELEYQAAADGAGRVADDADFFRAVCIELAGRQREAAAAYRSYLARPRAAHQAEAQKRLSTLQP